MQKGPKIWHLGTITQLYQAVSLQLRYNLTIGKKNLLNSNTSTCPYNMVNFGPLMAEIGLPVWGTPAHFNGFRVLAELLHGTLVVGIKQRAPPIFGRTAIMLGIVPHSSFIINLTLRLLVKNM